MAKSSPRYCLGMKMENGRKPREDATVIEDRPIQFSKHANEHGQYIYKTLPSNCERLSIVKNYPIPYMNKIP